MSSVRFPDGRFAKETGPYAGFKQHLLEEDAAPKGVHPDGCFFCAGRHPSQTCTSLAHSSEEESE